MTSIPTIALLTDFGQEDWFVGTMHGVIQRIAPKARVIDLCHNIPHQDVRAAAFVLDCSYRYFPDQTVFCCVVDPGVGTERDAVCATVGRYCYVAPDNGLLSRLAERTAPSKIIHIKEPKYWLQPLSATFHGRDIMAPVAAHLSLGLDPGLLGPVADRLLELHWPEVRVSSSRLSRVITANSNKVPPTLSAQ